MRRLFLSFSGDDINFVRQIYQELSRQDLLMWDYSSPGEALMPGADLPAALRTKIRDSSDFVAVVSAASMSAERGRFTILELEHALEVGFLDKDRLVALVLDLPPNTTWPKPFDFLRGRNAIFVRRDDPQSVRAALDSLHVYFGLRRLPKAPPHARLPVGEWVRAALVGTESSVHDYNHAFKLLDDFDKAYARDDYNEAEKRAVALEQYIRDVAPSANRYFLMLVRGACRLSLGPPEEAKRIFRELLATPSADESAKSGLGLVLMQEEKYAEAEQAFRAALASYPGDAVATYNLHLARYLQDLPLDSSIPLPRVADFAADEQPDVRSLIAAALLKSGRPQQAVEALAGLAGEEPALLRAQALQMLGDGYRAFRNLSSSLDDNSSPRAWHQAAQLSVELGLLDEGLEIYAKRLSEPLRGRRSWQLEKARILRAMGRQQEVVQVCGALLERQPFGPPQAPEDFYWDGLANYLLGNTAEAAVYFSLSKNFDVWFADLLARDLL